MVFCKRKHTALLLARLCLFRGRGYLRLAQSGQSALSVVEYAAALVASSNLVMKVFSSVDSSSFSFLSFVFVGIRQIRAGLHELLVVVLDKPQRFGVELERRALVVDGFDSRKQFGVQVDRIGERGSSGAS